LEGLNHFFKLTAEQKQLVQKIIPLVDYDEPGLEKHIADMIEIEEWGDDISDQIVQYTILGHGVKNFNRTLAISQEMVEYAMKYSPPRFWLYNPLWPLWQSAARLENPNPGLIVLSAEAMNVIQNDPQIWVEYAHKARPVMRKNEPVTEPIGSHLGICYVYSKRIEIPELVQGYLDRAIKANDGNFIDDYLLCELSGLFEFGYPRMAVEGLKPLVGYKNDKMHQMVINLLVRIRNYDPDYIEDLLLRGDFPQEIADRVLANPTSERLTDMLSYQLAAVIYDQFILGPKTMRNELKWFLTKALDLSSFEELVVLIIREVLNIVLGEAVFNVPADAPSRQFEKGSKRI
jgi:hypothetical protein